MMLINEVQSREGPYGARMMFGGGGLMGNPEDDEVAGIMGNDHGEIPFTVSQGFGINSNSQNQRTAWEFIKFLSNYAVRNSMRMAGLPTHIEAFEERAELSMTGALFASGVTGGAVVRSGDGGEPGGSGGAVVRSADTEAPDGDNEDVINQDAQNIDFQVVPLDEEGRAILQEYITLVEYFTNQLNTFFMTDAIIEDIVLTEVREFFDGSRSAEDVAQTLQSRINLFLNE